MCWETAFVLASRAAHLRAGQRRDGTTLRRTRYDKAHQSGRGFSRQAGTGSQYMQNPGMWAYATPARCQADDWLLVQ